MKTIIKTFLAIVLTCSLSFAGMTVKLTWDAPLATDPVPTGYALYKKGGTAAAPTWTLVRRYDLPTTVTSRTIDITADGAGTYTVTAYNAGGESDRSNEVIVPGKPGSPSNVKIQIEFQ